MAGRQLEISMPVKRIVSLVPSQTEMLYHLGLEDKIVGQTLFCIHPADIHKTSVKVGGTKKIIFEFLNVSMQTTGKENDVYAGNDYRSIFSPDSR